MNMHEPRGTSPSGSRNFKCEKYQSAGREGTQVVQVLISVRTRTKTSSDPEQTLWTQRARPRKCSPKSTGPCVLVPVGDTFSLVFSPLGANKQRITSTSF